MAEPNKQVAGGAKGEKVEPQTAPKAAGGRRAKTVSLYFSEKKDGAELLQKVEKYANEHDRSINWVITQAIREFVDRHIK